MSSAIPSAEHIHIVPLRVVRGRLCEAGSPSRPSKHRGFLSALFAHIGREVHAGPIFMSKVLKFESAAAAHPGKIPSFEKLIEQLQSYSGSVLSPEIQEERPLYGETLYIANCSLDTRFGPFHAYIFQDIIDKHYIIALTHGDVVSAKVLYTRLHSSCVTSETLRGCDCDCVQQLEGAFKVISEKKAGILFYLMQEGRGVGYVGKARDRMLVQASLDQLSTFQAYAAMGLKKDHRSYDNISQICYLLGVTASFVVLTNNPDKIDALKAQGLTVLGAETLEFEPSPFNLAYLTSKAASGHILKRPAEADVRRAVPPEPVVPFKPHALANARRFIYAASYFLPLKPVDDDILLTEAQFKDLFNKKAIERYMAGPKPLLLGYQLIRENRYFVRIAPENLTAFKREHPQDPIVDLLTTPYWFRVHVYYDVVTSQEFVVLTHGKSRPHDVPVIRLQSESLFNRFPLRSVDNRDKFKKSIKHIVTYGVGAVLLLYYDGRGAGFGAYATDLMMSESGQAGSSDDAYRKLGVGYDSRDYDASMTLLKHHIPNEKIQMVMNSPASLVKKKEYAAALNEHHIEVDKWIFLDEHTLERRPDSPGDEW
jgi:3,4-dihydroxy 2-butanone 4-phosphate synthase/GTP cyclohydrolase II